MKEELASIANLLYSISVVMQANVHCDNADTIDTINAAIQTAQARLEKLI